MEDFKVNDIRAYELAKHFLLHHTVAEVTEELLEKYLHPLTINPKPLSLNGVYKRILESAQNANMKAGVIGKAIGGVDQLAIVTGNFDPKIVLQTYGDNWKVLLDDIVHLLNPRGKILKTSRSIWPQYCQTIISSANFIRQFTSPPEFYEWVEFFDKDDRARASLPMLLSKEIKGFGFALSCDFLKELGYVNFPKPDVHLRDILVALKLSDAKDDYKLFKDIVRVAKHVDASPYHVDKIFWLIGSGYFYDNPNIGKKGRIGSRKKEFIEYAAKKLW